MKIIPKLSSKYTPYGGIFKIHEIISNSAVFSILDKYLPKRKHNAQYTFKDIILSAVYNVFCGGQYLEDIQQKQIKDTLYCLKNIRVPSADTMARSMKSLATAFDKNITSIKSSKRTKPTKGVCLEEKSYKIDFNETFCCMIVELIVRLGLIKKSDDNCLDFDQVFIEAEKYDSEWHYSKKRGYYPAVGMINNIPFFLENRNGNVSVKYQQREALDKLFMVLDEYGIKISKARLDGGSYMIEVVKMLGERGIKFYIRARHSEELLVEEDFVHKGWKKVEINHQELEVNSMVRLFGEDRYRYVVYKKPNRSGQLNLFTGDAKDYLFIITNDWENSEEEIIRFYNGRGSSEKVFDELKNDMNWNEIPFSFLEENTVFMNIMMVAYVLLKWLKRYLATRLGLQGFLYTRWISSRLKRFQLMVVHYVGKIVRRAREDIVTIYCVDELGLSLFR